MLIPPALFTAVALALLVLTARVAALAHLPAWRRVLPSALALTGLAASLSRAFGQDTLAGAVAFPCYAAAAVIALVELRRAARHRAAAGV